MNSKRSKQKYTKKNNNNTNNVPLLMTTTMTATAGGNANNNPMTIMYPKSRSTVYKSLVPLYFTHVIMSLLLPMIFLFCKQRGIVLKPFPHQHPTQQLTDTSYNFVNFLNISPQKDQNKTF